MRHSNNREVAHVWAQQYPDSTEQGEGSNFYYVGGTIYSYGSHFPIAKMVFNKQGERVVLFTEHGYSSTTSKHISFASGACCHLTRHTVDNPVADSLKDHRANHDALLKDVKAAALRLGRTNKRYINDRFNDWQGTVNAANNYAVSFGIKRNPIEVPEDMSELVAASKLIGQKDKLKEQRKHRAQLKACAADVAAWEAGDRSIYSLPRYAPTVLRLRDAETVETSQHAYFPLEHAKKAWRAIQRVIQSGKPFKANGHTIKVGHYAIETINAAGDVKAGCHHLKIADVRRFAESQGW